MRCVPGLNLIDAEVVEDAGPQSLSAWATFNAGASNEPDAALAYTVSNVATPKAFSGGE